MRKKVLVTGSNGQLAKTIRDLSSGFLDKIDFTFTTRSELNITNKAQVKTYWEKNKFDYCVNCAAYTNVENAENAVEIAFKINAEAIKHLAQACKKANTVLIHISTDYVFDGKKTEPYTENDQTNPINEYGKSKLLGEHYIEQTLNKYFIIRTSWLYSIYGNNFLKTIVNKLNENAQLKITTSQTGTPTSCEDLSFFIFHIILTTQNEYGVYNFSAQGEATWYDFAVQISKHFLNYDAANISPVKAFFSKAKRPEYSVLNNSKSQQMFLKKIIWRQGVDKAVKKLIKSQ